MSTREFLRELPPGWRVVEAKTAYLDEDEPPFGASYDDLLEDFVIVYSDNLQLRLEVDWRPERSPTGQFFLSAIDFSVPERLADSYAHPRRTFTTRSLRGVIGELRAWTEELTPDSVSHIAQGVFRVVGHLTENWLNVEYVRHRIELPTITPPPEGRLISIKDDLWIDRVPIEMVAIEDRMPNTLLRVTVRDRTEVIHVERDRVA